MPLRFVFGLHNHQPVGNFDGVFEQAYRDGYLPFLELMEQYGEIAFTLHTSGPLLEWLADHRPEYVDRLRALVARGQVEILGGAFYEPILPMIPRRDRVGQIRAYTSHLRELLRCKVRGLWLAERVWEPELVTDLVEADIEFTLLDDYCFKQAGLEDDQLFGYYLTEDEGELLKVFPISETMRYLVPWKDPEDSIRYFGEVAARHPDAVIVCADDGEKFGGWPETHKHCYTNGWLRRFFDLLRANQHWLRFRTLSQALDETPPAGTIYLPDCSYREMTEWALPAPRLAAHNRLVASLRNDPREADIKRSLRGGFWRNFRAKYPEVHEMYCRILQVSEGIDAAEEDRIPAGAGSVPNDPTARINPAALSDRLGGKPRDLGERPGERLGGRLSEARRHLYQAECNCAHWHGAFGGLYLPHLRNAVYHHLIAAENALASTEASTLALVDAEARDFNLDTLPEVCLNNLGLAAYFIPHRGGSMYELDLRAVCHNLLATLSRRPEAYHHTILQAAGLAAPDEGFKALHEQVKFKQPGLEKLLQYDRYPRKSVIDHFYAPETTLADLAALRERELGDFVTGVYKHNVRKSGRSVNLTLQRAGNVDGVPVVITKEIGLRSDSDTLAIRYVLEKLPPDRRWRFGVEFNFAGMAAGADDRYFYDEGQNNVGQLQTLQDLSNAKGIGLVDEWLGLDVSLSLSRPGGIWAFPVQTVSQSEGGFELVHQSTAVVPHWIVEPDAQGKWETTISLKVDTSRADARRRGTAGRTR